MRRLVFVVVSFLLVCVAFVQRTSIPVAKASSSIFQGDLILTGNNVTTIEGIFGINGSIIVRENATLILRNALVNFTQEGIMNFEYPTNGNPRLSAHNSTIASAFGPMSARLNLLANSTAAIDNSTISGEIFLWENSVSLISNSSLFDMHARDYSTLTLYNSTIESNFIADDSAHSDVYDSKLGTLIPTLTSVNCTVSSLKPDSFGYWSLISNCTVGILPGGSTPNITLTNVQVNNWGFDFYGNSSVTITNSSTMYMYARDSSRISLKSSTNWHGSALSTSSLFVDDSVCSNLYASDSSVWWLLNSTYYNLQIYDSAEVYVSWYLDTHVVDSISQNVPSANVIASYPNATLADSKLTDSNGWSKLTLMEKMMNNTGQYPIGNYTVQASYGTHTKSTTVNMTENVQITLALGFVIPEFPSTIVLPLFMIATLLTAILYKRKRINGRSKINPYRL